jgi:galactokinase/mevalonate kinase-like predicted kinase
LAAGGETSPAELAQEAARIEIEVMGRTVGKQDQWAAAHGGLRGVTKRTAELRSRTRATLAWEGASELPFGLDRPGCADISYRLIT